MENRPHKLKVLHLIESLGSGGAERLLHTNLKHIDPDRFENEVVTVFANGDYWLDDISGLGVRISSLHCAGYRDIPRGIRRLRRRIASSRPDVIHTHLFAANVIGRIAGRMSGVPVISSVHMPEYEPETFAGVSRGVRVKIRVAQIIDSITARLACSRMIAVSRYVKETRVTRLGVAASMIDVIYNPVDLAAHSANDLATKRAVIESLGLTEDSILILCVGRISPEKGIIHAIRAMPDILGSEPNAHLIAVGAQADEHYAALVRQEISALGLERSVHLMGERRDVHSLLTACDMFLFPSLFEGLGIALAEAMTVGRACVASRIRPLDEFVEDGVNGILVEPGSATSIAEAVISLMGDDKKRRAIGESASVTAQQLFRPEPAARKLEEVYRRVLKT